MRHAISSADPLALWRSHRAAEARSQQVLAEADRLAAALSAVQATCTEYPLGIDAALADPLRAHARRDQALGEWVRQIGAAFARADQGASGGGLDAAAGDRLPPPASRPTPSPTGVTPTTASAPPLPDAPATVELSPADVLDGIQMGLDVVGLIPGVGEIADLVNATISLGRGDYLGASLSLAAMIPDAGAGATGAKWAMRYGDEVARLVHDLGEAEARRLVADLGDETIQRLVTELSPSAILELVKLLGPDAVRRFSSRMAPRKLYDLAKPITSRVSKERLTPQAFSFYTQQTQR
ncbi:MAG: hypothetical protein RMM29_09800 [Planctomycetota bacterium]|nr:hypothetical protein [Planctomycetota bacterium]